MFSAGGAQLIPYGILYLYVCTIYIYIYIYIGIYIYSIFIHRKVGYFTFSIGMSGLRTTTNVPCRFHPLGLVYRDPSGGGDVESGAR